MSDTTEPARGKPNSISKATRKTIYRSCLGIVNDTEATPSERIQAMNYIDTFKLLEAVGKIMAVTVPKQKSERKRSTLLNTINHFPRALRAGYAEIGVPCPEKYIPQKGSRGAGSAQKEATNFYKSNGYDVFFKKVNTVAKLKAYLAEHPGRGSEFKYKSTDSDEVKLKQAVSRIILEYAIDELEKLENERDAQEVVDAPAEPEEVHADSDQEEPEQVVEPTVQRGKAGRAGRGKQTRQPRVATTRGGKPKPNTHIFSTGDEED